MSYSDNLKASITEAIDQGEKRLTPGTEGEIIVSGLNMEGVHLLGRAESLADRALENAEITGQEWLAFTQRIDSVWATYVKRNNLSGLGACAAMVGRNG